MRFFVGLHQANLVRHFDRVCLSINRLKRPGHRRKSPLALREGAEVLLDSGAFTEIALHGGYRHSPHAYANTLRWAHPLFGDSTVTAVAQDYMCEAFMLAKTGLSVLEHQRLTIERYDALLAECPPMPIMPVLQGYDPADYVRHLGAYGARLAEGAWVGVGSVCKRNSNPKSIVRVLEAIHARRPDLRLHGFGVKWTSLLDPTVRLLLDTADSMAWSFAARREGRNANSWLEAEAFRVKVEGAAERPVYGWEGPLFA